MKKSFTLIEVVFAVGIIVIFLGSLIALFDVGSKNMVVSAHRLQAANLARGAVEAAREVRDTAKSQGIAWTGTTSMDNSCWLPQGDNYLEPNCNGHLGLKAKSAEPSSTMCPPLCNSVLFNRTVNVVYVGAVGSDIRKITATVSWTDFGQPHSVIVTTYLTNY
ncbi:MAG: hypothetical protein ABSE91_04110 [Patescibacteria group bacterium]|jgi:type II secretory pathway pseudopilin PulG